MDNGAAQRIDVSVNISPDILKNMNDLEKLIAELVESLNQAVKDNVIDEKQAQEVLEIARENMMRILGSR